MQKYNIYPSAWHSIKVWGTKFHNFLFAIENIYTYILCPHRVIKLEYTVILLEVHWDTIELYNSFDDGKNDMEEKRIEDYLFYCNQKISNTHYWTWFYFIVGYRYEMYICVLRRLFNIIKDINLFTRRREARYYLTSAFNLVSSRSLILLSLLLLIISTTAQPCNIT